MTPVLRAIALTALLSFSTAQPASAQSHAARTVDLFALRELGGPRSYLAPSPDGQHIAVFERAMDVARDRYTHEIVVIDLATSQARRVARAGDIILASDAGLRSGAPLDRRPVWSADGAWIYYIAEVDGRAEVWRAAADGSGSALVIPTPGDVRRLAVAADAVILETATPRDELAMVQAHALRFGFRVNEDFKPLASMLPTPRDDANATLWRFSLANGSLAHAEESDRALLSTSPRSRLIRPLDPTSTAVRPALGLFDASENGDVRCMDVACGGRLEDAWRLQDDAIIFLRRQDHALSRSALYRWSPRTGEVRQLRVESDRLAGCIVALEALHCVQDFSTQPPRLVRIDAHSGALSVTYDPNPEWRSVRLPRIQRLEYTDAEGNESFAQLVYPAGYRRGRRYPLVVVQYRALGFLNAGTGREAPIFPLAAQGYFVLSVDRPEFREREMRMSARELQQTIELDGSESRTKREANLHFIAELDSRGLIDMSRIGITGMSDGAQTLFDMLTNAPIFAAAVASSPPNDPILWPLQSGEFRRSSSNTGGLSAPWDTSTDWHRWWNDNTPAYRANEITTPLLLNMPEAEALRAFPLLARLESTNTPVETWIYPGAYHLKWRPAQIAAAQTRSIDWLNFWLRSIEPDASDDTSRVSRWNGFRDRQRATSP